MPVFNNILAGASGATEEAAYQIDRSLRFNSGDSAYLNRTPSSAGNRKTWTWSGWVKRSTVDGSYMSVFGAGGGTTRDRIQFFNDQKLVVNFNDSSDGVLKTSQVFRDPSAWQHIVVALDTTQATASNRLKIYVNGSQVEDFDTETYPSQNYQTRLNNNIATYIGQSSSDNFYFDGYLAEVHFVDGQQLAATDFGEEDDNGVWQPKEFAGTHNLSGRNYTGEGSTSGSFYDSAGGAASKMFDGSASTGAFSSSGTATFTFGGSTITASTSLKVRAFKGDASGANVLVNGTNISSLLNTQSGGGYSTVDITSTLGGAPINLSNVSVVNVSGGSGNIAQIFVDDVELVDVVSGNGFYLKFADNSSNAALGTDSSGDSNTWTVNNISGPGGDADYASMVTQGSDGGYNSGSEAATAFDGSLTTAPNTSAANNNGNITFTPSSSISHTTSVRAYWKWGNSSATYSYNGGSNTSITASGWITLASGSGTFTSLNTNRDGDGQFFSAIEIDGSILINSTGADNDSLLDSPTNYDDGTNVGGNYCVMNPLDMRSNVATQNGNMEVSNATAGWSGIRGTIGVSSGKWYYELQTETASIFAGIATAGVDIYANAPQDQTSVMDDGALVYCDDGKYLLDQGGSANRQTYGSALANGDILGVAIDLDGNTVQFYKNGSALGSIDISSSPLASNTVFPYYISYYSSTSTFFNFGQRPFAYTPPTGYVSLCTTNLPDPTIADGSTAFNATLYTGNGSARSISTPYGPDLVWIKSRSAGYDHGVFDVLRGANQRLSSNSTSAEGTEANSVTAFNSDSFSLGSLAFYNNPSTTYVAWNWDAGTSTVSNTDGSITSSVRANASAGISIVSWTGRNGTVGHGLNDKPGLIITKIRNQSSVWPVQHSALGTNILQLQSTGASAADSDNRFNATAATSSVFTAGTWWNSDSQGIAYCFAPVEGFSAFGSYTGNGSTDGPFVYTGFRPAFVMLKRKDSASSWQIRDTSRSPDNVVTENLYPNLSNAESTDSSLNLDILSNGFKPRTSTDGGSNASGGTYIYAAFAEHPFKTARAR